MCHVLIIEDDPLIADVLGELGREAGATSIAFATTEGAAIASARATRPALILSDVRLAKGTGPRAIQAILEDLGPTPVIFITATPDECEPRTFPSMILTKPFRSEAVINAILQVAPPRESGNSGLSC